MRGLMVAIGVTVHDGYRDIMDIIDLFGNDQCQITQRQQLEQAYPNIYVDLSA